MNKPWSMTVTDILRELDVTRSAGLTTKQAERLLERHGRNELAGKERESLLSRFLAQMKDPMILVLLAAALLSLVTSGGEDWVEAVIKIWRLASSRIAILNKRTNYCLKLLITTK